MDIKEVHEKVFIFLLKQREVEPNLRYNLRYQDRAKDLTENHYWFHGSKITKDVYITFWNMWTTVFPTINFVIHEDGTTSLHIDERNAQKTDVWEGLSTALNLERKKDKNGVLLTYWSKPYLGRDYLSSLSNFITNERPFIDSFLKLKGKTANYPPFPEFQFLRNLEKIENIRKNINEGLQIKQIKEIKELIDDKLIVKSLKFKNINAFNSLNITFDKRVTCFVGGNGSGKTTILRGLALALVGSKGFKADELKLLTIKEARKNVIYQKEGQIDIVYELNKKENINTVKFESIDKERVARLRNDEGQSLRYEKEDTLLKSLVVGFSQQMQTDITHKTDGGYSPKLNDIEFLILNNPDNRFHEFQSWIQNLIRSDDKKDKEYNLKIVNDIFSVINDITGDEIALTSDTDTFIKTKNNPEGISIDLLSQGYRNVLAWLGFFIKRLLEYRDTLPFDEDILKEIPFKELPAVCLIDEIDTYLHPNWQYAILSGLVEHFPNVQFFITSHSPFVLTSVPSEKIAIFELNTEGGQIVINEKTENLYGADANRAADAISTERKHNIQAKFDELDVLIEENKLDEAQIIIKEDLNGVDSDLDLDILRAKRLIRTKLLLQKAKLEEAV